MSLLIEKKRSNKLLPVKLTIIKINIATKNKFIIDLYLFLKEPEYIVFTNKGINKAKIDPLLAPSTRGITERNKII